MINPIDELLDKKLATKAKLEKQVEDAKDSVRRANNKLDETLEALGKREDEVDRLEAIQDRVTHLLDQMNEANERFSREGKGESIEEYWAWVTEKQASKDYSLTYVSEKPELLEIINQYKSYLAIIDENSALARKVYYNR